VPPERRMADDLALLWQIFERSGVFGIELSRLRRLWSELMGWMPPPPSVVRCWSSAGEAP
jgi:hypothetical protein